MKMSCGLLNLVTIWMQMKNDNRFSVLLAILGGMILFKFDFLGINQYKKEIITLLLIYLIADTIVRTSMKFKKFVFLKTKYDILYRIANLTVGVIATGFLFWGKPDFFEFGWMIFIISFLGVFNGIVYQYSVQMCKKSSGLMVVYKHRNEKLIERPDSIVYTKGRLFISDNDGHVEINDLKDSFWNKRKLKAFLNRNFSNLVTSID